MKEFAEKLMASSRKKYEGIEMSSHTGGWIDGARKNHRISSDRLSEIITGVME